MAPFNNLLRLQPLLLVDVEVHFGIGFDGKCISFWALELANLRVYIIVWTLECTLKPSLVFRLSGWPALKPRQLLSATKPNVRVNLCMLRASAAAPSSHF